jgi:hypothetical protein
LLLWAEMNTAVQKSANAIYERASMASGKTAREEKREFAQTLALRRRHSNLPLSGPEFQAVVEISGQHVERCIRARFDSYRQAFTGAEILPTDQDFQEILNGVNDARDQEARHSATSLQQYAQANGFHVGTGTGIDPAAMLMAQVASAHDEVVSDWKVWRAEIELKAEAAKSQQTTPAVPKMSWTVVRKQIWSWPVIAVVATLFLGVAGNPIYAGDVVMTSILCSLGLALLVAKFVTWDQIENLTRRFIANVAVIFAAGVVLYAAIGLAKKKAPPPLPPPLITMQISPTSLPVSIPPHTVASILQMHPYIGMTEDRDGLLKVANDTGREGCWPKRAELATLEPNGHEGVYRVEIINHSERTVEGGKAKFGIKYNVGLQGGGCMAPSDQRPDQYDVVLIPPLDPGKTFEFYATNPSNSCAWLLPPGTAMMKISGQEKEVDVPLTLDKNPLYSAGAPSFSPTAIKWEGVPTHPNGLGVIRTGSESCEAIPSTASNAP